jgi:hypothetical protein
MRHGAALLLLLMATTTVSGQSPAANTATLGARTTWSTNVLGVLQFGPNLEFERAVSATQSLGAGARLPTLGVMSHVINDGIRGGWSAYGTWRLYPQRVALRRWYVGPHVEFGGTSNETFTSRIYGGAAEFGHRWIKPSGFSIVVGGLLGTFRSDDTWKDGTGSAGSENYFVWMLNVSLGVSR